MLRAALNVCVILTERAVGLTVLFLPDLQARY